ncbi:MAG: hypothetical protein Q8P30_02495 [Candidatus Uhrbacteria bacterium]|nr:hypothetical protein [Candidatus Uhrbacteria bacterium]
MDTTTEPWVLDFSSAFANGSITDIDEVGVGVTPDLWCNVDYKDDVKFEIQIESNNDDACKVTLVVRGFGKGEEWEDRHEFDDCFDIKLFLPKRPVVLAGMEGTQFGLETLGAFLLHNLIGYSINNCHEPISLTVHDPSHEDKLEDQRLEFVFQVEEGRRSVLSIPWSFASKYFVVED